MTPFEVYRDYLALRNHFNTPSYNYFKYQGKSSIGTDSFVKRRDRFFFEKVAKHRDPHSFMLANFVQNPKAWIRDMAYSDDAEQVYQAWQKVKDSLTYTIQADLEKLQFPFDSNFLVKDGQCNHVLTCYMAKEITLETTCVLADLTQCIPYWDKQLKDNVVWEHMGLLIKKYTPFIKYDPAKIKHIVVDFFRDAG
jgi:hypothetical protein